MRSRSRPCKPCRNNKSNSSDPFHKHSPPAPLTPCLRMSSLVVIPKSYDFTHTQTLASLRTHTHTNTYPITHTHTHSRPYTCTHTPPDTCTHKLTPSLLSSTLSLLPLTHSLTHLLPNVLPLRDAELVSAPRAFAQGGSATEGRHLRGVCVSERVSVCVWEVVTGV